MCMVACMDCAERIVDGAGRKCKPCKADEDAFVGTLCAVQAEGMQLNTAVSL